MSQPQPTATVKLGQLAQAFGGRALPLQILQSQSGLDIGTSIQGFPFTRESNEYFRKEADAEQALVDGNWTQKTNV
jgi:hypothetical protein